MIWVLRACGLVLLFVLAAGYLMLGCLALVSDGLCWLMNAADRVMQQLAKWGEAL